MQGDTTKQPDTSAGPQMSAPIDIRNLTDEQFLVLGLPNLVYIRRELDEGEEVFAIRAANGQIMGMAEDPEEAFDAINQHDMVAMTIH